MVPVFLFVFIHHYKGSTSTTTLKKSLQKELPKRLQKIGVIFLETKIDITGPILKDENAVKSCRDISA